MNRNITTLLFFGPTPQITDAHSSFTENAEIDLSPLYRENTITEDSTAIIADTGNDLSAFLISRTSWHEVELVEVYTSPYQPENYFEFLSHKWDCVVGQYDTGVLTHLYKKGDELVIRDYYRKLCSNYLEGIKSI